MKSAFTLKLSQCGSSDLLSINETDVFICGLVCSLLASMFGEIYYNTAHLFS